MIHNNSSNSWRGVRRLEPDLSCYLRGYLYSHSIHAMPSFYTLRKVRGLRKFVFTIIYLILLACPSAAYPRSGKKGKPRTEIMEDENRIIVRTSNCKPVSQAELLARMGPYFDESKMRLDDVDDDVTDDEDHKRSSSRHSVIGRGEVEDEDDMLDSYSDPSVDDISDSEKTSDTMRVQNIRYMRRKRDAEQKTDSSSSFLYPNMLYETISKRKSRQKRGSGPHFQPAWSCRKKTVWKKMVKGYFPSRILDGKCAEKSCFFHQYRCNPVKYALKVLKRDPKEACNPVPLIGNSTTYEESWVFKRIYVTVACECGLPSRKRNRGRKRDD